MLLFSYWNFLSRVVWPGPVAKLRGDDRAPLSSPALPLTASYEAFDLVCVGLSQ